MPLSGTVQAGIDTVLASQYNNLRDDVLNVSTGHTHTGVSEDGKLIPTGGIADLAITQAKCIYGIPVLTSRQGGSSGSWIFPGTIDYTLTTPCVMQAGAIEWNGSSATHGEVTITYHSGFSTTPILTVIPMAIPSADRKVNVILSQNALSSTGGGFFWDDASGYTHVQLKFLWIAIGQGY
jgi:hypothetical protein